MDDMTASGQESLRVGAGAFRAAVMALDNDRVGAATSVRRIAAGLEKLARSYRQPAVELAARNLLDTPAEGLRAAAAELLAALAAAAPSVRETVPGSLDR